MIPLYFGEKNFPLFGAFHEAQGDIIRDTSILICNPFGFEHEKTHSLLRELAIKLSKLGYAVLRFDYSATGDSAKKSVDFSIAQSVNDAVLALDELKDMSANNKFIVIGLRLGGTIASFLAQQRRCKTLILWDPILKGNHYLGQLKQMHQRMLARHPSRLFKIQQDQSFVKEFIGYPYSDVLLEEFNNIDVKHLDKKSLKSKRTKVTIIQTERDEYMDKYMDELIVDDELMFYQSHVTLFDLRNDWWSVDNIGIKNLIDPAFKYVLSSLE